MMWWHILRRRFQLHLSMEAPVQFDALHKHSFVNDMNCEESFQSVPASASHLASALSLSFKSCNVTTFEGLPCGKWSLILFASTRVTTAKTITLSIDSENKPDTRRVRRVDTSSSLQGHSLSSPACQYCVLRPTKEQNILLPRIWHWKKNSMPWTKCLCTFHVMMFHPPSAVSSPT